MNCHLQAPTSAKQGKHWKTHDEMHRILLPRNATFKDGPQIRRNGHGKQDAPKDQHQGPPTSYLEEDRSEGTPFGLGRPNGSPGPLLGLNGPSFLLRSPIAPLILLWMCIVPPRESNRGSTHGEAT